MAETITKAILSRHSTRAFKSDPIPQTLLEECLNLAQHAPSNSNLQPWRLTIVQDAAFTRLKSALLAAADDVDQKSVTEPIPASYRHYRSDLGHALYGKDGYNIPREAKEQMTAAQHRNYNFFDAPMAMILCMDTALSPVDVLSCGLYLQTLCMLLQERGIGNCIEVSVAGYPSVIRRELGIAENMMVITGMAIGYEDETHNVNNFRVGRDAWKQSVTIVSD